MNPRPAVIKNTARTKSKPVLLANCESQRGRFPGLAGLAAATALGALVAGIAARPAHDQAS